jgi:hypothetical protein
LFPGKGRLIFKPRPAEGSKHVNNPHAGLKIISRPGDSRKAWEWRDYIKGVFLPSILYRSI